MLQIGLLSDEVQEARKKDMKKFRENNTKKNISKTYDGRFVS